MIKIIFSIIFSLIFFSCADEGKTFNSANGGHTRSNNYEGINKVFSNYISYKEFKFSGEVDSSGFLFPPFFINSNDYLYISKSNKIHVIIDDRVMSTFDLETNFIASNPCKDENDNVYFQAHNGTIYSYNLSDRRQAKLNWKTENAKSEPTLYSDLVYMNNKIYSSSTKFGLEVFNTDGKLDYKVEINNSIRHFAIANDNSIYISTTHDDFQKEDTLIAIKDGKVKYKIGLEGRLYSAPICIDNEVVVPILFEIKENKYIRIVRLDENGKLISKIENNIVCKYISADNQGNIYTISSNSGLGIQVSYLDKYDKTGKKLWAQNVDLDINSPMLICDDAAVFCGERDGATGLFYFDKNSGKLSSSIALASVPLHSLVPVYKSSGGIVLGAANNAGLIVIERSSLDKIMR